MKIVFAGTPLVAKMILETLLTTSHEVVAIYTQPDRPAGRGQQLQMSPVKTVALAHPIPVEQPVTLKTPEALANLAKYQADVMIVVAYGLILPEPLLSLPRYGCINVHVSLLPRWRGAAPIQRAILAGDQETGITLMQMDAGLDTGKILAQISCPITEKDTAQTLHDTLATLGATFLRDKLEDIINHPNPLNQDNAHATYAAKITKEEGHINWNQPAIVISRIIRAFNPWPVAYSKIQNQNIRIWEAQIVTLAEPGVYGTIIAHHPEGIIVACQDQGLLITQAQLPGKKCMPVSEIIKGHATLFAKGNRFES